MFRCKKLVSPAAQTVTLTANAEVQYKMNGGAGRASGSVTNHL
jgi:hypothetical protein